MASFYIMDGHGYTYQLFYAISNALKTSDGIPTNAVFGFAKLLEKILSKQPDYLAVCFDAPGRKIRHQVFTDYKANRKPMPDDLRLQLPWIKELLAAYRIPVFELAQYEADDLMATLAKSTASEGVSVYLLTQDKDLQQMVNEAIKIYDDKEDRVIGREEVLSHFHLTPELLPHYFALIGDATDNIPGVKGIGAKTAVQLLQKWPSLEQIYEHVAEVIPLRVRNLLLQKRDQAFLSRQLFILDTQIPLSVSLPMCRRQPSDTRKLRELFSRLEFHSLLARMGDTDSTGGEQAATDLSLANTIATKKNRKTPHPSLHQQQEFGW
jgi:DNA polymerase-1